MGSKHTINQYYGNGLTITHVGSDADSTCYTDQAPDCVASDDVHCTDLAPSYKEACCPRGTTCAAGYPHRGVMRCHMDYGDLTGSTVSLSEPTLSTIPSVLLFSKGSAPVLSIAATSHASLSSTTSATASMTEVPSNYDHRTTETSSTSLPTSTLIGIIVGVVIGVCLVAAVG